MRGGELKEWESYREMGSYIGEGEKIGEREEELLISHGSYFIFINLVKYYMEWIDID